MSIRIALTVLVSVVVAQPLPPSTSLRRRFIVGLENEHTRLASTGDYLNGIGFQFNRGATWGDNLDLAHGRAGFNALGAWQVKLPFNGWTIGGEVGPGRLEFPIF